MKDENAHSKKVIGMYLENGGIKNLVCSESKKLFFRSYALNIVENNTIEGIVCYDGNLTCCQRGCCRQSFIQINVGDVILIEKLVKVQLPLDWGIGKAFIVSINGQRILLNMWTLVVGIRYHRFTLKRD